jgi:hypothetical protein
MSPESELRQAHQGNARTARIGRVSGRCDLAMCRTSGPSVSPMSRARPTKTGQEKGAGERDRVCGGNARYGWMGCPARTTPRSGNPMRSAMPRHRFIIRERLQDGSSMTFGWMLSQLNPCGDAAEIRCPSGVADLLSWASGYPFTRPVGWDRLRAQKSSEFLARLPARPGARSPVFRDLVSRRHARHGRQTRLQPGNPAGVFHSSVCAPSL